VSVRDAFESLLVSVSCPICGYEFDVAVVDVRLEARTFCPNCKKPIQLVDADASAHRSGEEIDAAMRDLKRMFG
jgi:uncharacterized Zn finger protein (UPF0148 family)